MHFRTIIGFCCKAWAFAPACVLAISVSAADDLTQPLKVSPDGRFLARPDGRPFFWLGDTAWSMFTRMTREEADVYLRDRAAKGFNVIQAVALSPPYDQLSTPNRYGELALKDFNYETPNPAYFEHIDWIVQRAAALDIHFAMLPVWGATLVGGLSAKNPAMTPQQARSFGRWIAARYRGAGIIWVMGGDTNPIWPTKVSLVAELEGKIQSNTPAGGEARKLVDYRPIYDAMAQGVMEGNGGDPLITYHPSPLGFPGGAEEARTSAYFHDRTWLDFNMLQSSHHTEKAREIFPHLGISSNLIAVKSYEYVRQEWDSRPVRPVIDAEPRYEGMPVDVLITANRGLWDDYDARNAAYHAVFAGAAGHTFGNLSVHLSYNPALHGDAYKSVYGNLLKYWRDELNSPGAQQMSHLKTLMLSRTYFTRIPDQSLIVGDAGEGTAHIGATRDKSGDYAMIYVPQGQKVTIDLTKLSGARLIGWWYDPRSGTATPIKDAIPRAGTRSFTPPSNGKQNDWVLVLDNATSGFTAPGTQSVQPAQPIFDADGTLRGPGAVEVPYSSLASEEAKRGFVQFAEGFARLRSANAANAAAGDIPAARKILDDVLMRPGVERLRAAFPVSITPEIIGGVQTDVIMPQGGVAAQNKQRLLINVHGGGFMVGARYGGQQESIPIASLGKIKVITVDYRMAPEHTFPAASEDVATVYKELLKQYQPEDIGIYGCSAGGMLAAQSVAWFQTHNLPRPGAIGIFGAGGVLGRSGDSDAVALLLGWGGGGMPARRQENTPKVRLYFSEANVDDPLVAPARSPEVLRKFPPSLLISGTRDAALSVTVYTHAQLVKANVEADLHVWEGAPHCSFAQPVVDPAVPETREAWDVTVRFFDKHLGKK